MSTERNSMIMKTFASKNECKLLTHEGKKEWKKERIEGREGRKCNGKGGNECN